MKIILASTSPRRIQMMKWLRITFNAVSPEVDEMLIRHSSPRELTRLLAEAKAVALQSNYKDAVIIGSDAVVSFKGNILEKPNSKEEQRKMINLQKGKEAEVYSSVCVINTTTGKKIIKTKVTPYKMATPTDKRIEDYIESGSGMDKAGGYGQQDEGGLFVDSINGCYTNAIGFPLCEVAELLEKAGVNINTDIKSVVMRNIGKEC